MSGTREKLIELIASKVCDTYSEACEEWLPHDCGKCYANNCHIAEIADHLIANGVVVSKMETATIATDNPVGDKLTPTEPQTNCQPWIPVTERLPDNKEHDWVLAQVVEDNGYMHIPKVMEYRQALNDWYEETYGWLSEHNGAFTVTHWMPLPQPPKGE